MTLGAAAPDHDAAGVERSKVLFVGGVRQELATDTLLEYLGQYGQVRLVKRCRGYVYVKFDDPVITQRIQSLDHYVEGCPLTLQPPRATKKEWFCKLDPDYPVRVRHLGEGIVKVENILSIEKQQELLEIALTLGEGESGFYVPTFCDARGEERHLHLEMFCLGRHWDCKTHCYGPTRSDHDRRPVLAMPGAFAALVPGILADLAQKCGQHLVPAMRPDICVVNSYSASGSLGLHQDTDESAESISSGAPVVSISIGDTARLLYRRCPDVVVAAGPALEAAGPELESVLLRSGDVFIFGGASRLLHHGVAKVFPNTTPKALRAALLSKPGRVNLTFRQL